MHWELCIIWLWCNVACAAQYSVKGGVTTSLIKLLAADNSTVPSLVFGNSTKQMRIMSFSNGDVVFQSEKTPLLAFKGDTAAIEVKAPILQANSIRLLDNFLVNHVPQWRLAHREEFSLENGVTGWDNKRKDLVTECAGIPMLGGFGLFSKGEISKVFTELPSHNQLRIVATYHFIDDWDGETGFMRCDIGKDGSLVHIWTDQHNQKSNRHGVNVCGTGTPEGKFASPIDIAIEHTSPEIRIAFGATIENDDPQTVSWGISVLEIHVR